MPIMGIEKLYVAKQLTDTSKGMTFTVPKYFKNVQAIDIKPKTNSAKAYAENRLIDQATLFDSAEISVSRYSMTSAERAFILGQAISKEGGSISSDTDVAPYVALMYKAPIKVDGVTGYRYGVIYKAMFTPPEENMKGLEGKPDLTQVAKLTGSAQPTEWSFRDQENSEKHPWEYHVDTTDPGCPENIDDIWFNNVPVPSITAVAKLSIVSSLHLNNATGVLLSAKPAVTFNNEISGYESVVLINLTDGSLVDNIMSLDNTGKILNIAPSAAFATGKVYNIVLTGVTDIYGQVLPQQVVKFTAA